MAMEAAITLEEDIALIEEPLEGKAGEMKSHPGFTYQRPDAIEGRGKRVWIAIRKEARVIPERRDDLGGNPDIIIMDI